MLQIYFANESSLSDTEVWRIAWACNYQAQYHMGRAGWRSDARCHFLPGGAQAKIPVAGPGDVSAVMHFIDQLDEPGALGYHDEDGNGIPFGRVGVKTTEQDGGSVSEVASHETLELAEDEHVDVTALTGDLSRLYAWELGDAVQGNAYDVGAPEGRTLGIVVADFVLPAYFDPKTPADQPTSFRGSVKGPFALGPKGYYSYLDLANVKAGWQQKTGGERTAPVRDPDDPQSRMSRRAGQAGLPLVAG